MTTYELGAGGVVLNDRGEVLLVRYKGGGWTFPKGHIDPGEKDEQAAVREVLEETGVHADIIRPLSATRYTNDRGVHREIHWFLMHAREGQATLESIFEAGGFFVAKEAAELLSYPEDRVLLQQALGVATEGL